MKRIIYHLLLVVFLVTLSKPGISQYNIKISIPNFPNDTLLFGHYFNESIMLQDTFFTDGSGMAVISKNKTLPYGMYTIYFPNQSRFDLLIDTDQDFSIKTDTLDLLNSTKIKNSFENAQFYSYLKFLDDKRKVSTPIHERIRNPINKEDSISARLEIKALNEEVNNFLEELMEKNKGTYLAAFILSMKEVEVPEAPLDEKGEPIDKNFQRNYYKEHYFENFDLSDVRLLRTPVYERKITTYLDRVIPPIPDSIYKEVDMLIEKSRSDTLLFKYMLTTLFNYYAKSKYVGMDAVYAYIGEKYYIPEATWSSPEFIEKLKERVEKINPLIIGKKGPDIQLRKVSDDEFILAESDSVLMWNPHVGVFFNLYEIKAKFTVLYFWEPDCGHCKKTIPQLHEMYQQYRDKGLEVIAVNMLGGAEGKVKWTKFINKNGLYGWINAWNPYDFSYKDIYDVGSSNILYLLDENKNIIAKKIGPEQVEAIISRELNKEEQQN